jgi:serine/threonine protein kinase
MSVKCPNCDSDNTSDSQFCKKCGTPLPFSADLSVTKTLETPAKGLALGSTFAGRYQIMKELGRGGMGAVYKAFDTRINGEVAIKLLRPEIAADEKTLERFSNELKLARKISHKNVYRMYHLDKEEDTSHISMEYLEGQDLKKMIWDKEKLPAEEAIGIAQQVCEGLVAAHRLGVVQ